MISGAARGPRQSAPAGCPTPVPEEGAQSSTDHVEGRPPAGGASGKGPRYVGGLAMRAAAMKGLTPKEPQGDGPPGRASAEMRAKRSLASEGNAGFGAYSYACVSLAGVAVISYACVCYNSSIIVPASACELGTNLGQQGVMVAGPFVAGVFGSVLWGYLGDIYGRKKMLVTALSGAAVVNALASLSINWIMMVMLQCISTLMASGVYPLAMTLLSESIPLVRRNQVMLMVSALMMASQGVMASLAIPIIPLTYSYSIISLGIQWNSWRTLMLVYSMPAFIALVGIHFFVQESPKFVLVKGDAERTLKILRKIHRVNNLTGEFEVKGLIFDQEEVEKPSTREQIVPLFKRPLRKYTLIMTILYVIMQFLGGMFIWLPKISNQYVQLLQTGKGSNLSLCSIIETNIYSPQNPNKNASRCSLNVTALLMVLIVCAMQFVSNGVLSLVVNRFGRRNSVMVLVTICGASGALVNLVPNAVATALLFAGFLVGIIVVGPYTAMAVSLFPTHLRTLAVAITISSGRLCGFFTIQIVNYMLAHSCRLGFFMFSAVFASSAFVLSLLPDDSLLNKPRIEDKQEFEEVTLNPLINKPRG